MKMRIGSMNVTVVVSPASAMSMVSWKQKTPTPPMRSMTISRPIRLGIPDSGVSGVSDGPAGRAVADMGWAIGSPRVSKCYGRPRAGPSAL
ncbi:hypothetical protein ACFQQE_07405 [Glycomyces mayteni]|uniref:hypothetical protein n=1 Tax=Glycomyces mayteni TaxID=543887 RepID=UPI00361800F1